ncbi:MAG TPA: PhoU domain-containing protein, partial [Natronosporangium sp.]|nr:PhoU domain-containing protein [Natronosporangium sp.]
MRERFRNDLTLIADLLVEMADGARAALRQATSSLLHSDADQARLVIAGDEEIDAQYRNIEEKVYEVIALQAPVASDLRLVLTALHIAGDLERMGDLAVHVAKTGLRRHPSPAVPEELTGIVREMGSVAD